MGQAAVKGINTPYDSAFKSIVKKCPRMTLFLINEMFYRNGLTEEKYEGSERILLLDKELPSLEDGMLVMDQRIMVCRDTIRTFHLECQSTTGSIILRMVRYDVRSALDEAEYTISSICIKIDYSGILFLRSTKNTPDMMTVNLEIPQEGSVSYKIPIVKMQDYTLDQLIAKKLFLLIPFLFFNHEKELMEISHNPARYHYIRVMFETILNKLKVLEESEVITAYEAIILYDTLKVVFIALGKKNNAEQEVETIMGGEILEFEADKYFDAGRAEGIVEGKENGEEKLANLVRTLISNGRSEEVARAASDKQFRASLYEQYAIL